MLIRIILLILFVIEIAALGYLIYIHQFWTAVVFLAGIGLGITAMFFQFVKNKIDNENE